MAVLEKREAGRFTIFYFSSPVEPEVLVGGLRNAQSVAAGGRGGIRVVEAAGRKLAVRAYRHGGLLRAFTRSLFLDEKRAVSEGETMAHLVERSVPVAAPFAAVVERVFLFKRLYLVTLFEEGAVSLLEYMNEGTKNERARAMEGLAGLLRQLEQAGVFHRDLHFQNVLVTREGGLMLLDFDRAAKRGLLRKDVESMVRRLWRFADKMAWQGRLSVDEAEKAVFMKEYERLSGCEMSRCAGGRKLRSRLHRLAWRVESIFRKRR
jgi:aminoglycoside phosphotransferase (APT) family kinase protein